MSIVLPRGELGTDDGRVHGEVVSENRPHLRAFATRKLLVESAASYSAWCPDPNAYAC